MCNIVRMAKGVCPLCGSEEVTYDPIKDKGPWCDDPELITYADHHLTVTCDECGCRFEEIYETAYVGCEVISRKGNKNV